MIELRDTIRIDAAPEQVWGWLESLADHYRQWHPDHLSARWLRGSGFVPGAVMEVSERLHGKPHTLRMSLTDVAPGQWIRYRMLPGLRGELAVRPVEGGSEFSAVIGIGVGVPLLAPLLDGLLRLMLGARIEALRLHQAEEGVNLKGLLEASGSTGA